jgi:hypothetical protein
VDAACIGIDSDGAAESSFDSGSHVLVLSAEPYDYNVVWFIKPGSDDRILLCECQDRVSDGQQGLAAPTDRDNLDAIRLLDQAMQNGSMVGCANGHREYEHDRIAVVVEPHATEVVVRQRLAVPLHENHIDHLLLLTRQTTAIAMGIVVRQVGRHVPSVAREVGSS